MQAGTGQGSDGKSSFHCQSPAGRRDRINHSMFLIHQRSVSNKVSLTWLLVKPVGVLANISTKAVSGLLLQFLLAPFIWEEGDSATSFSATCISSSECS